MAERCPEEIGVREADHRLGHKGPCRGTIEPGKALIIRHIDDHDQTLEIVCEEILLEEILLEENLLAGVGLPFPCEDVAILPHLCVTNVLHLWSVEAQVPREEMRNHGPASVVLLLHLLVVFGKSQNPSESQNATDLRAIIL
eukprot:GHVO01004478.1.p3 GENE.GHVO01004478.1~~GHVO01004478.1.p3  ORF type:complete len:142 (+),score=14.32 GHVO01004478.1:226-651(+)